MVLGSFPKSILFAILFGFLAACDSAEERAETHYKNGISLLESGDVDRALVEFRNVLALDEFHRDARTAYAEVVRNRGNIPEAYSHFLRLAEEDPNDMTSRLALAEMAIAAQNWREVERHSATLKQADAKLPGTEVVDLITRFRKAILDKDDAARSDLTREAAVLVKSNPDNVLLLRLLVEGYLLGDETDKALEMIDHSIEIEPNNRIHYSMKASILAREQEFAALEDHVRLMIEKFPDDDTFKTSLVRLLVRVGQLERAEEFLREQIAIATPEKGIELHVSLVVYLREVKDVDAALAEIDAAIPLYKDSRILSALRSGLIFDRGQREEAIAEMQSVIDNSEPSEATNKYKITLAKMLEATGNEVGARQLVGEVLNDDPSQTDALKISAKWLIASDQIDEAINSLRTALDQAPQDAEAMTLMASAHRRAGETELAQDLLSLAAEASNYAPKESLRFVQVLLEDDRFRPAEDVLINALRESPGNLDLLRVLGDVYLRSEDWPRAIQVEATLRRQDGDLARRLADNLNLQIKSRREGRDQALALLEQLAEQGDVGGGAQLSLLQAKIRDGDPEAALAIANEIAAAHADSPRAQIILGNTQLALRDYAAAETTLRNLVDTHPDFQQGWIYLLRSQSAQGRLDDARETVDEALANNPDAPNILWAKASFLERANDIDGAIEIYELLYERNSGTAVVANNLASLLATYRDDEASLERAFVIGRRLRGTEVPPFQDTYGWILYRRGELEESVTYLKPAADALREDPIVQYHLASAYAALGQNEDALLRFKKAIELAGRDDPRPQIEATRAEIKRLSALIQYE
jgi:tetratricopeptide (TPR) repeat protein